ncbi:MAG: hypothetical protein ACKOPM_10605 [Novosphingobium sp.]
MASASTIQRPVFYEGQIVSAADLNSVLETARIGLAQHERYLHTPGIAKGLQLVGTQRNTLSGDEYQEITVQPGLAIDGNGRHLLLGEAERLSEDAFNDANVAISDATAWYPVFLSGRDEVSSVVSGVQLSCGSGAASRIEEIAALGFGRIDEAPPPNATVAGFGDGPSAAGAPWRVLLGFVQWDAAIKRFAKVQPGNGKAAPTYVGVRADSVEAQGGKLALRSADGAESGKPAVEIDTAGGGELRFGLQNSTGAVVPVFTVKANGDLFAAGKISGAVAGGAQFQTGSATDGMLLPLPPGITQAMVEAGTVTVLTHVTPRYGVPSLPTLPAPPPNTPPHRWLAVPIECRVDSDRRVHCRTRWIRSDTNAALELPGVCDFQLTAMVTTK